MLKVQILRFQLMPRLCLYVEEGSEFVYLFIYLLLSKFLPNSMFCRLAIPVMREMQRESRKLNAEWLR